MLVYSASFDEIFYEELLNCPGQMSLQSAVERLGLAIHDVCKNVQTESDEMATVFSVNNAPSSNNVEPIINHRKGHSQSEFLDQLIKKEINEILEIISSINKEVETSSDKVNPIYPKMIVNPVAPPNVLSINHLRIVYTTIEIIWVSGIQPFVEVELGETFDWCEAPHPKSLLISKENLKSISKVEGVELNSSNTLKYCQCINSFISSSLFSANMLPRNLKRLLTATLILSKSNRRQARAKILELSDDTLLEPSSDSVLALQLMTDICLNSSFKSLVVSELRIATKGPRWMRSAAGEWFNRILLSDLGFEAVLKAYLEGVADGADSLPLQINVAKLVTSVPSGFTREDYLRQLSPQIVDLIKFGVRVKDSLLLQTCVLVVTRIAHLCSGVCDSCLVIPLVSALLKIDDASVGKSGSSSSGSSSSSSSSSSSGSEDAFRSVKRVGATASSDEDLTAAVGALHTLVTLCPMQPPLMASLQRSGACRYAIALTLFLISERRDHRLLVLLKEICFIMLKSPTGIDQLAGQLHQIILHPTRNRFVISREGFLSIEYSVTFSRHPHSRHAAADLARRLGVSTERTGDRDDHFAVISSPPHLLAAMQSTVPIKSSVKKTSAPCSLHNNASDGDGERGKEGEGVEAEAGRDVKDILSMAVLAASSLERLATVKSGSILDRANVLEDLQNVSGLWGQGEDGSSDENVEEIETQSLPDAQLAHVMLEVSVRAKAAAELLLEQISSLGQGQGQGLGDTAGASKSPPSQRNATKKDPDEEGEGEAESASVTAELFILCLQAFLRPTATAGTPAKLKEDASIDRMSRPPSQGPSQEAGEDTVKGLSGLVLVILQAHISLDTLLQGGSKVIGLLQTVLKAHADSLEARVTSHQSIDSSSTGSQLKKQSEKERGPLIVEIGAPQGPRTLLHEDSREIEKGEELDFMKDINMVTGDEETEGEGEEDNSQSEILSCALGILIGILSLGKATRSSREESSLRDLLLPLQVISYRETDRAIAQTATDAALLLLTRWCSNTAEERKRAGYGGSAEAECSRAGISLSEGRLTVDTTCGSPNSAVVDDLPAAIDASNSASHTNISSHSDSSSRPDWQLVHQQSGSVLQQNCVHLQADAEADAEVEVAVCPSYFEMALLAALRDQCSSAEPYVRAFGVHSISSALNNTTQPLTAGDVDVAIAALITLLQDEDSYVYLCVLTTISKLADLPRSRGTVFKALLEAFSDGHDGTRRDTHNGRNLGSRSSSHEKDGAEEGSLHLLSYRHRSLVGEALATVLRRAGDAAGPLVPLLVPTCIRFARVRPSSEDTRLVENQVNLRTMKMDRREDDATLEDDSSTHDQAALDDTLSAALASDRALLRQSAMSLLAEAVVCAGWGAPKYLVDILDIAAGVLSMEGVAHRTQTSSSIRRSAAFLLRHMLSGLGDKLILMKDGGLHLKTAYHALKLAVRTDDQVVRYHSEAALGALDEMMRDQLFLSEAQLRGEGVPKIRILR